jgi:hypothetical protein
MIGLVYVLVLGGHLLLSIWLVKIAMKAARKTGKPGWYYGLPVGLFMFSLLYWDLIPTLVIHRCYCFTEGGFTEYKSLDEWKLENPGILEKLTPKKNDNYIKKGNLRSYILNQRFEWNIYTSKHPFGILKIDEQIVDRATGQILAEYIDFNTNIIALGLGPRNFRDYKSWLKIDSCEIGKTMPQRIEFNGFKGKIEDLGEENGY